MRIDAADGQSAETERGGGSSDADVEVVTALGASPVETKASLWMPPSAWDNSMTSRVAVCGSKRSGARCLVALFCGSFAASVIGLLPGLPTPGGAAAAAPVSYRSVAPRRILDSRIGLGTTASAPTVAGLATSVAIPAEAVDAAGVALNLTITDPVADGYATAYPCGGALPLASNVNFRAGQTVPNLVIAKPGADGQVCVVTSVAAQLIVDFEGWFPAGSYAPLPLPQRVLDTRDPGREPLRPGVEVRLFAADSALGVGGVAMVANVTVVDARAPGYLVVYPCGSEAPVASNLNFIAGETVANLTIGDLGTDSGVCAVASAPVDVVVDVQGALPVAGGYTSISPVRMADTRAPIGVGSAGRMQTGQVISLSFPTTSGIPAAVDSVVVNVTATDSLGVGFVTVFPCGGAPPLASNVNIVPGYTRPSLVLTRVGADGTICVTGIAATHVVVDLQGWFAGSASAAPTSAPIREHVETGPGVVAGYLAYLPAGYASSPGRTWPTIVFLHGSGQTGPGTGAALDGIASNGLPRLFENGTEPPSASGFVVLAPQFADGSNSPARLRLWLSQVLPRYGVDRDRVYLTGLSAGGFFAFDYLGATGDSNEFAAIVPIAGGFNRPLVCDNWRHTAVWAFHGEADTTVSPTSAIRTVNVVNSNCAPGERLRLTTYPGVGHNSWDLTYDLSGLNAGRTNPAHDPYDVDIYQWMLQHVRSRSR